MSHGDYEQALIKNLIIIKILIGNIKIKIFKFY
jgi:hypothetical protein